MESITISIATFHVKLVSDILGIVERFREMYFLYEVESTSQTDLTVFFKKEDLPDLNEKLINDFEVGNNLISSQYYYRAVYNFQKKEAVFFASLDNYFAFAEEYLLKVFSRICLENKQIVFHSLSLLGTDNSLYLLYGPSGIGKSTSSRNICNSSLSVYSDDLIVLEPLNSVDGVRIHKTPFERDKSLKKPKDVKLRATYRLKHSETNYLKKQSAAHRFASILGNLWLINNDKENASLATKAIEENLLSHPGFYLHKKKKFSIDKNFLENEI